MMGRSERILVATIYTITASSILVACSTSSSAVETWNNCQSQIEKVAGISEAELQKRAFDDVPPMTTEGRHVDFFYGPAGKLRRFTAIYYGETGKSEYSFIVVEDGTYRANVKVFEYSRSIKSEGGIGEIRLHYEKLFDVCKNRLITELLGEVDDRTWRYVEEEFRELYYLDIRN